MRKIIVALSLCLLGAVTLTDETPAKPLRHLEYAFTVHEEGVTEYHFNGIGVIPGAGVGGGATSDGGSGTMYVDVLSVGSDGALSVKVSEDVLDEARPRQAYTCAVYGNTTVLCPSVPAPSDAEWVLLSYLGREFVNAAPWDAQHHWQRKLDTSEYKLVEDFSMSDKLDANLVLISEEKKMEIHNGGFGTRTDSVQISYDRSMEVPSAIHDDVESIERNGSGHEAFDFKLTADSFAKKTP